MRNLEGKSEVAAIMSLSSGQAGATIAHACCHLSAGSPWDGVVAKLIADCLTLLKSSFSFSDSWTRDVFSSMTKHIRFPCRTHFIKVGGASTPISKLQPAHAHRCQLILVLHTLHPSSFPNCLCPVYFKLQQRKQSYCDCLTIFHIV